MKKGVFKFTYLKYIEEEDFVNTRENILDLKKSYASFQNDKPEDFNNFVPKKSIFV